MIFPLFYTYIECECPKDRIVSLISNHVSNNSAFNMNIETRQISSKITLAVAPDTFLYYNSFSPSVCIMCSEKQHASSIEIWFQLKKSSRIFLSIYLTLALLFEVALLAFVFSGRIITSPVIVLPLMLIFFLYTISFVGLKLSSQKVLRMVIGCFPVEVVGHYRLQPRLCSFRSRGQRWEQAG